MVTLQTHVPITAHNLADLLGILFWGNNELAQGNHLRARSCSDFGGNKGIITIAIAGKGEPKAECTDGTPPRVDPVDIVAVGLKPNVLRVAMEVGRGGSGGVVRLTEEVDVGIKDTIGQERLDFAGDKLLISLLESPGSHSFSSSRMGKDCGGPRPPHLPYDRNVGLNSAQG